MWRGEVEGDGGLINGGDTVCVWVCVNECMGSCVHAK